MGALFEDHPEMTETLQDFAFVSKKTQGFLADFMPPSARGRELSTIWHSWTRSVKEGTYVSTDKSVTFQVFGGADPNTTLCVTLKPNKFATGSPWVATYAGRDTFDVLKDVKVSEGSPSATPAAASSESPKPQTEASSPAPQPVPQPKPDPTVKPAAPAPRASQRTAPPTKAKDLKDFAFVWLGPNSTVYRDIESRAQPETWGFREHDHSILYSYIVQTFYKLRRDGLVLENEARTFAALNTGLVTPAYEDLFMCFVPNDHPDRQPWAYAGICTQFDNHNKKLSQRLRDEFREMPRRATYFTSVTDIVFDASKQLISNWDHIIVENVDRLPTSFIARHLYDAPQMRDLVESISYDPDRGSLDDPFGSHAKGEAGQLYDQLRTFLRESPVHYNRITDSMEGALRRSVKRAEYSFRTGVPSFYPTINKVQMLLPLCLNNETEPDVALVAGTDRWGNYEGRTILSLRMAYNNARLLCRPESEWLNV